MKICKSVLLGILFLIICSCSSGLIQYKNKSYYDTPFVSNKLYLFPIPSVEFDDTTRNYAEYYLKIDPYSIQDSILNYFNFTYLETAKKYVNRKKVTLLDTVISTDYSTEDTNQYLYQRIYDKKKENLIKIKIPKKTTIEAMGIHCNFAFFITDVKISQTSYYIPIIIPLPGAIISGNATGPAFGIQGKYILWDYDKECSVCAGNFKKNFMTCNIGKKEDISKLNSLTVSILNKAPFWKIFQSAQNE